LKKIFSQPGVLLLWRLKNGQMAGQAELPPMWTNVADAIALGLE
jgi:hypothetical protein